MGVKMIKGILFDKDGTLIDFFSIWPTATRNVLDIFCVENGIKEEKLVKSKIYEKIGMTDDEILENAKVTFASYTQVSSDICEILKQCGYNFSIEKVKETLKTLFKKEISNIEHLYKTFTDNEKMLQVLKEKYNLKIGLATADDENAAKECLQKLNVLKYFDYVGGDDNVKKSKPHKDILVEFCKTNDLREEEVIVVGDTKNDMAFAKNNNAKFIAVLSGVGKEEDFLGTADYIINSVDDILNLFKNIELEKI